MSGLDRIEVMTPQGRRKSALDGIIRFFSSMVRKKKEESEPPDV